MKDCLVRTNFWGYVITEISFFLISSAYMACIQGEEIEILDTSEKRNKTFTSNNTKKSNSWDASNRIVSKPLPL